MIFDQVLSTNSIRQCVDTSVEDFVFGYWGLKDKVTNLLEVGGKTRKIIIVL